MRRTGVLTFHRCINYGSYWQARCLVEALRQRGQEPVLLDYESPRADLAEWKCGIRPVLPTPVPRKDYFLYALKILKFYRALSLLPRSRRVALEDPSGMERFDRVVVGSDEVWNLRHPWYGGCSLFWGVGIPARRLVSYAASFGSYHASEGLDSAWADRLRSFASISIRDENSRSIVRAALGIDPELVLDPCLLAAPPAEDRSPAPRRQYVAVYGHNFSQEFAREVRRWARSRGYPLVSIGYRNAWAHSQWITAGPHDFARFIARARAVATNFFHGCVFALRHARPFVCEASSYRWNKLEGLTAAVGGEKHFVGEGTPAAAYDAVLEEPLDPAILQRIAALRRSSEAYLDRALV